MSREAKELIAQLEHERDTLLALVETVEQQIAKHEITEQIGEEILERELRGRPLPMVIRQYNLHIQEALAIAHDERRHRTHQAIPLALILLFAGVLAWNVATLTGLVTFDDETYYQVPLDVTLSDGQRISLPITEELASVRVSGEGTGSGTLSIYLVSGDEEYLVAKSEPSAPSAPSGLTGFVVDDAGETTPSPNETNTTVGEQTSVGSNASENESSAGVGSEGAIPIEELPATPPQALPQPTVEEPQSVRAIQFDAVCEDTCSMSNTNAPYELRIEIEGGVSFTLEQVTYSVVPYNTSTTQNPSENSPTGANTDEPPVAPQNPGTQSQTGQSPIASHNNTSNGTAASLPVASLNTSAVQNGSNTSSILIPRAQSVSECTRDADCAGGVCQTSTFQGVAQPSACVASNEVCLAAGTSFAVGAASADSICIGNGQQAAWFAQEGQGRFTIANSSNQTVAIIDKYGSMAVRGSATAGATPTRDGWVLGDASGIAHIAIDDSGNLVVSGAISQQVEPQETADGDFVVRSSNGTIVAVLSEYGDVQLAGILLARAPIGG